jgi:tetratricopeptide (TPR) repeat protein
MHEYAAHTFLEILRHKPQDGVAFDRLVESCHALAQLHIEEKRYPEAINLLQEVLKVKSDYGAHQTFLLAQAKLQEAERIKEQQAAMEEMTAQESGTDVDEFIALLFADQPLETLVPTFDAKDDAEFAEALQSIQAQDFQKASDILEASPEKNRTDAYRLFTLALTQKELERREEALQTLRPLTEANTFNSRVQLWAWLALRSLGEQLDANLIYRTLGVIIQVHVPEKNGVETLAIYLDGRVRHVNANGQILVWDRTEGDISESARNVVYTAQAVANDFPSEQRRDPLKEDSVRISLLTAGGVRVLEDDARRVRQQTSIMSPVFTAGTELLEKLLAIYNAT